LSKFIENIFLKYWYIKEKKKKNYRGGLKMKQVRYLPVQMTKVGSGSDEGSGFESRNKVRIRNTGEQ
jgi:hypothetical protein